MFPHTAINELFMSHHINTLLAPKGLASANRPLGWIEYHTPVEAPFAGVVRCCGVFATAGDRRLGDHVLRGLELLLPQLISTDTLSLADMLALFPPGVFGARGQDNFAEGSGDETHMQLLCGAMESPHYLANLQHTLLPVTLSAALKAACPALQRECEQPTDLLGQLCWQLGLECGMTMRVLQQGGVCWGSFRDHTGLHCNAHSNNMALVIPDPSPVSGDAPSAATPGSVDADTSRAPTALGASPPLLAPLDFDFAYLAKDAAVLLGAPQVAELLATEPAALAMDLGASRDTSGSKNNHAVDSRVLPLRYTPVPSCI